MLKKELIEAINVLILHSDFCDINIDDDRFEVKFSYYGKKDIINSTAEINNKSKFHLIDSIDHINFPQPTHKEKESDVSFEEKPIIPKISDKIWPRGKRPSSDIEWFKIIFTRYVNENPGKNQNEIAAAFGITNTTVFRYLKKFNIPYNIKPGGWITKKKIFKTDAPQKAITIEHDLKGFTQSIKETNNCDMPNHLKKELHNMIKDAVLNINIAQTEAFALKEKFDNFRANGNRNLITSTLGTWILKPLNGSDSHLEFIGLAISAPYQLFPRWEIGTSYCILQFYGNTNVEYIVNGHDGQMRVSRRP